MLAGFFLVPNHYSFNSCLKSGNNNDAILHQLKLIVLIKFKNQSFLVIASELITRNIFHPLSCIVFEFYLYWHIDEILSGSEKPLITSYNIR